MDYIKEAMNEVNEDRERNFNREAKELTKHLLKKGFH